MEHGLKSTIAFPSLISILDMEIPCDEWIVVESVFL